MIPNYRFLFIALLLLTLAACSSDKETTAGKYIAQGKDTKVVLTLNEDGRGIWSTDTDEIPFKWSLRKNGQLWLHTKTGGVIQSKLIEGKIRITLPGVEELIFTQE